MPLCVSCFPLPADSPASSGAEVWTFIFAQCCLEGLCGDGILRWWGVQLGGPSVILSGEEAQL